MFKDVLLDVLLQIILFNRPFCHNLDVLVRVVQNQGWISVRSFDTHCWFHGIQIFPEFRHCILVVAAVMFFGEINQITALSGTMVACHGRS